MARRQGRMLDSGEAFPDLALNLVGGGRTTVAEHMGGKWGTLLLYRGGW